MEPKDWTAERGLVPRSQPTPTTAGQAINFISLLPNPIAASVTGIIISFVWFLGDLQPRVLALIALLGTKKLICLKCWVQ